MSGLELCWEARLAIPPERPLYIIVMSSLSDENRLAEALDCDLIELLADGWARAPLLAEFADPDRHPPGERWSIALGEHELGRDLRPVVAVTIGSCPCVELAFDLALTAHFGGVQLTVADGRIVGGSLGEAWASAELSYQGVPLHEAAESRRVALPAAFEFAGPGIAIPLLA